MCAQKDEVKSIHYLAVGASLASARPFKGPDVDYIAGNDYTLADNTIWGSNAGANSANPKPLIELKPFSTNLKDIFDKVNYCVGSMDAIDAYKQKQLVAYGAQDVYLTGNSQITFFNVTTGKITNAGSEIIQLISDKTATAGKQLTVSMTVNDNLIDKVYIDTPEDKIHVKNFHKNLWKTVMEHGLVIDQKGVKFNSTPDDIKSNLNYISYTTLMDKVWNLMSFIKLNDSDMWWVYSKTNVIDEASTTGEAFHDSSLLGQGQEQEQEQALAQAQAQLQRQKQAQLQRQKQAQELGRVRELKKAPQQGQVQGQAQNEMIRIISGMK